jgi:hypothetical protein
MRYVVAILLLCSMSSQALAGKLIITGHHGSTTVGPTTPGGPYTGVINKGDIHGGSSPGLTVTGTAARSVTNYGTITGTTGLSVSGSSSSVITNTGTISGVSTSGTSALAVGVSQLP